MAIGLNRINLSSDSARATKFLLAFFAIVLPLVMIVSQGRGIAKVRAEVPATPPISPPDTIITGEPTSTIVPTISTPTMSATPTVFPTLSITPTPLQPAPLSFFRAVRLQNPGGLLRSFITIPESLTLSAKNPGTIELWFRYFPYDPMISGASFAAMAPAPLFGRVKADGVADDVLQFHKESATAEEWPFMSISMPNATSLPGKTKLSPNQWHHVAAVYTTGRTQLYIDGKLENERTQMLPGSDAIPRKIYLGRSFGPDNNGQIGFYGEIDELRLSDNARYTQAFTPGGPFGTDEHTIGLWHFDGNAQDETVNKNNVIFTGPFEWVSAMVTTLPATISPTVVPTVVPTVIPTNTPVPTIAPTATPTPTVSPTPLPAPLTLNNALQSYAQMPTSLPLPMPVLVLSYFPRDPNRPNYLDFAETGWGGNNYGSLTIADWENHTQKQITDGLTLVNDSSRYHGYKDPGAPKFFDYFVLDQKTYYTPIPRGYPLDTGVRPNYRQILSDVNICDLVDNKGVKEVWMYGYHSSTIVPDESRMSSKYGDVSNSWPKEMFLPDNFKLPVCNNAYVLYNFTYQPGGSIGNNVHNRIHQIENVVGGASYNIFWNDFSEKVFSGVNHTYRSSCGNAHYTPNWRTTPDEYNYAIGDFRESNCQTWNPNDALTTYTSLNCLSWGCTDLGFYKWFMQNMPGYKNGIVYDGKRLRNWWEAMYNYNLWVEGGNSLFGYSIIPFISDSEKLADTPVTTPTPQPTIVPTSTSVPTAVPTAVPTITPIPTAVPTSTPIPTATVTSKPETTAIPTAVPTTVPTSVPTDVLTPTPTVVPTDTPAPQPPASNGGGGSSGGGSSGGGGGGGGSSSGGGGGGGNSGGGGGSSSNSSPAHTSPNSPVVSTGLLPARRAKRFTRIYVTGYDDDAAETISMAFGNLPPGLVQGPSRIYTQTYWKKVGKKWVKSTRKFVQATIQGAPTTPGVYNVTVAITDGATTTYRILRMVISR